MSKLQRVFLIASCILFVATIYSLFFLRPVFIILFFVFHSITIFSFCYQCYSDQADKAVSFNTYRQDIGLEIAEMDKEIKGLSQELKEKVEKIKELNTDIDYANAKSSSIREEADRMSLRIMHLEEENKALKRENDKAKLERSKNSHEYGALLPPITGEEERETVNIIEIAEQAKNSLLENAKAANLVVTVSCATDTLLVSANPGRLLTLFRNIIDNSIKYMNRAGSLVITISTIGDDIFIVLKDTGEGLPTEETKYIFELNYQGSNRISGNGLGLAQARAIVEYYGGTIYAKSTVGNGMGIYIQIPAGGRV